MKISRRTFTQGAVALLSAGLPCAALAVPAALSGARLEADLAGRLLRNPSGAAFTVTAFAVESSPFGAGISAEVRLDWSPGVRYRRFSASGRSAEEAYTGLRAAACRAFSGVVPGFDEGRDTA